MVWAAGRLQGLLIGSLSVNPAPVNRPFEVALVRVFRSFNRCFPWLIRARAPARNRDRETPFDYEHEHHPPTRIEHEHVKKPT